jgi:putative transcriptional regulator
MTASLEILEDISKGKGPNKYLLSLGYSGWGPGQLETEIQANGWLICDTPEEYLFTTKDDEKWDIALKVIGIDSGMLSTVGGSA